MMIVEKALVISNRQIATGIYQMDLLAPQSAELARAGQFFMLKTTPYLDPFLKRPMSINKIEKEKGQLRFIYDVVGRGTAIMSGIMESENIEITGPCGNGWLTEQKISRALLVGGGTGIAPLLPLAIELKRAGALVDIFLGAARADRLFNEDDLAAYGNISIATDDGSKGQKGTIACLLPDGGGAYDMVYTCGPNPMMAAVAKWAEKNALPCRVSLEERMGCGIGTCVGCVCALKGADGQPAYRRVCKEGPVFDAKEVLFNG